MDALAGRLLAEETVTDVELRAILGERPNRDTAQPRRDVAPIDVA
jgi:hypothetical protein